MDSKLRLITYLKVFLLLTVMLFGSSCFRAEEIDNSPRGNFEVLWKTLDRGYCYFTYKDIDWDEVYNRYEQKISPRMTSEELFEVLGEMTRELKDGHVNLASSYNVARYWEWYENYPRNFSEEIVEDYLGRDYKIAAGLKYKILEDNIGYIYYESFTIPVGEGNLSDVIRHFALCKGIIFDVRNNGGGNITNSSKIAARFTEETVTTGYIMHKKGFGHDDFSEPYPVKIEPALGLRWQKPVVVLTNRHTYSAANDFVNNMTNFPNVTIMGDRTGGGGGLAFTSELPNGWSVRYSASPHLNANKEHVEFGIAPDVKVDMLIEDTRRGIDTIIESARKFLQKND